MKRIFSFFLLVLFVQGLSAQNAAGFFTMTSQKQFDCLYKAINETVQLLPSEQKKLFGLMNQSLTAQMDVANSEQAKNNPSYVTTATQRQTLHIEGNMRNFLSADKMTAFEKAKPAILQRAADFRKKMGE